MVDLDIAAFLSPPPLLPLLLLLLILRVETEGEGAVLLELIDRACTEFGAAAAAAEIVVDLEVSYFGGAAAVTLLGVLLPAAAGGIGFAGTGPGAAAASAAAVSPVAPPVGGVEYD